MTSPLAEYDTRIAALRAEMEPIHERLSAVVREREAYADILAESTADPAILRAIMEHSPVAYRKFTDHVRATTHDAIWNFVEWLPIEDDYSTGYALGPHLVIERLAAADIDEVVESMVDFAERFCSPAPPLVETASTRHAGIDVCDMVFADILWPSEDMNYRFYLYYTVDGSHAYLLDGQRFLARVVLDGTLTDALTEVVRRYERRVR